MVANTITTSQGRTEPQELPNTQVEEEEVCLSIQFKLYNLTSPVMRDYIYATYSNPSNLPLEEVKRQLTACINVPEDKVVVMGDACVLSEVKYAMLQRCHPQFSDYYQDETHYIPIFRLTLEEAVENNHLFHNEIEVYPLGCIIDFDYVDEEVEQVGVDLNFVCDDDDEEYDEEEAELRRVEQELIFEIENMSDIEVVDELYVWDE